MTRRFSAVSWTKAYFERRGWTVDITEKTVQFPDKETGRMVMVKRDLFGLADLVMVHPDHNGTTYVQTTTGSNFADRLAKTIGSPKAMNILKSGNAIWVVGVRKIGERGKRKVYEPHIRAIHLEELQPPPM